MRFNSADYMSPFGRGGVNAYAYCSGDPVNYADHTGRFISKILKFFGRSGIRKKINLHKQKNNLINAGKSVHEVKRYQQMMQKISDQRLVDLVSQPRRNLVTGLMKLDSMEPDLYSKVVQHLSPGDLAAAFNAPDVYGYVRRPKTHTWLKTKSHQAANGHYNDIMSGTPGQYTEDGNLGKRHLWNLQDVETNLLLTAQPYTQEYARDKYKPDFAETALSRAVDRIRRYDSRRPYS